MINIGNKNKNADFKPSAIEFQNLEVINLIENYYNKTSNFLNISPIRFSIYSSAKQDECKISNSFYKLLNINLDRLVLTLLSFSNNLYD